MSGLSLVEAVTDCLGRKVRLGKMNSFFSQFMFKFTLVIHSVLLRVLIVTRECRKDDVLVVFSSSSTSLSLLLSLLSICFSSLM